MNTTKAAHTPGPWTPDIVTFTVYVPKSCPTTYVLPPSDFALAYHCQFIGNAPPGRMYGAASIYEFDVPRFNVEAFQAGLDINPFQDGYRTNEQVEAAIQKARGAQ